MAQHKFAVPTKKSLKKSFPTITPEQAQKCYIQKKLTDKENKLFICATKSCFAPLTCQNMTSIDKTAFFIEGKRTKNLHIDNCQYSDKNLQKNKITQNKEQESVYESSGKIILDTKNGKFPKGLTLSDENLLTSSSLSEENDQKNEKESNSMKNSYTSEKEKLPVKPRNKHLSSIGNAVDLYENNPNAIIHEGFLGQNIPINRYFLPIKLNHLPDRYYDRIPIYYGTGFAFFSKSGYYKISFSEAVFFQDKYYQPHFFVAQNFINTYFPFIYDHHSKKSKYFNIYIQSRFWIGQTKTNENVLRFQNRGKELIPFVYFTRRN